MFGGRYLRQRTALGSESTALQTETTLGLPTGQEGRFCGKNVINLLIFWVFLTFLANLQATDPRYFLFIFHTFCLFLIQDSAELFFLVFTHFFCRILGISLFFQAQNPMHAERTAKPRKKKGKKKQTGKPRLNLTRSLQQGNSR